MSADGAADAELAEQLLGDADRLTKEGHGGDELALAIDQLRADRTNGEPLTTAIRRLRAAIEEADTTAGGNRP